MVDPMRAGDRSGLAWMLIARIGDRVGAIPIDHVVETMRPLPIEPFQRAPQFVLGLAIVRGVPLPVIDGARLLGSPGGTAGRFVVLRTGPDRAALLVDAVLGVRQVPLDELRDLPALSGATNREVVDAIGLLDAGLLVVLDASRILQQAQPIA
jgi:purine-binding chemotaxis protein CheW